MNAETVAVLAAALAISQGLVKVVERLVEAKWPAARSRGTNGDERGCSYEVTKALSRLTDTVTRLAEQQHAHTQIVLDEQGTQAKWRRETRDHREQLERRLVNNVDALTCRFRPERDRR